ncbi:BfmA/BtgA family mobilization protein [Autumnicola psychrophila]|uniref:BfmA/BtgA family mobilization protein n=1 Tax=Autumnicola psychrophila TaxID=3075592 RepID=A0ABU3DP65_9FLAO|nr:BfmA/BtgA family mobilization protein [Zunongwangia sp. F225]MDT0684882.1 BfmA/BtgA family mobilization protein [Zunongwangia sp. F225]
METNKDRKTLFSAISINRITAARFRKFSKNIAPSHSESLDDMMDFFEVTKIHPRSPIFRHYIGLYNYVIGRLDFIVALLREQEDKYHKPTYNILAGLFQKAEIIEAKTKPLEENNVRRLTREQWELEDDRFSLQDYNSIKDAQKKDREEFKKMLLKIIDGIEKVNPTFGKPYLKLNIDVSELHIMKRKYE